MEKTTSKNVIIIGGGLAGLSAGYELLAKGEKIKVTIIEALDRLGGKVYTPMIDGVPVDVGGL